jgi:translation initiation factor 3 subunit J
VDSFAPLPDSSCSLAIEGIKRAAHHGSEKAVGYVYISLSPFTLLSLMFRDAVLTILSDESSSEEESSDESVAAPPVVGVRKRFDDEEDSDQVADNWMDDDSDAEREKAKKEAEAKAKAAAIAAANRKPKAQRIEERREANRLRQAEMDDTSDEDEDEAERKARLKAEEKNADLAHAQDLFGDIDLRNNKKAANKSTIIADAANPGQAIDLAKISLFQPKTKTQFDHLSTTITPLIRNASSQPHFSLWMPSFAKGICQDMNSADIKKVASALTALSNEKMKEEKAKDGVKKSKAAKSKTTLAADRSMGRGVADTRAYDDEDGLDDGDFM